MELQQLNFHRLRASVRRLLAFPRQDDASRRSKGPSLCEHIAGRTHWRGIQSIMARIQKTYAKGREVNKDKKARIRQSKRLRQTDVSIRLDVAGDDLIIVVENSKWNKKPSAREVESFLGMMDDVKAYAGTMLPTIGLTKSAMNLDKGSSHEIEAEALLQIWELTPSTALFQLADGTREAIKTDERLNFISTSDGSTGSMAATLQLLWDTTDEKDQKEGPWVVSVPTTCPDRPEISRITLGADCKLLNVLRHVRLQFEGSNESVSYAHVEGWKMVFDRDFISACSRGKDLQFRTSQILLKGTYVHLHSEKSRVIHESMIQTKSSDS